MNMVLKSRRVRDGGNGATRVLVVAAFRPISRFGLAFGLMVALGACSSTLSRLPTQLGGEPADTPQAQATPAAYPAVHHMPPPGAAVVVSSDVPQQATAALVAQRTKQEKDAARDAAELAKDQKRQ